ncbi:MAG: ATP-dependent helicase, partial [Candidatus Pacebacteria bacterium]|nr:ATP-dependent helicase [Candidatus Paceibacterota bacterium]
MTQVRTTPEFNTRYAMLNAEQKSAVDTIEGPVMVVAGPGTGKTQILTLRIANILKQTDTDPSAILALTFTEAGVAAMRKRLVSMIGPDGYRVGIYTFHGFCNTTIQRFPEDFPRLISSDAITDIDKVLLMRELISERENLKELRPFYDNFAYVMKSISAISELKREYIDPVTFKELVQKSEDEFLARDDLYNEKGAYKGKMKTEHQKTLKRIEKNKELIELYEGYEKVMQERKLYDYEDMIGVVVGRLDENRDVLQRLQEEYHYVLADEHQDANTAQNRLLELLVDFHDDPNLFIVGDEKQAIFRFQGASLENFLYFKKKYPKALVVELKHSYRSGQKILDSAHSVITSTGEGIKREKLESRAAIENDAVELRTFSTDNMEALWIARDIEKQIGEGIEPHEIAVLYRTNADAAYIARALERERVPYTVESNRNVLDDPAIAQFILLLRTVADFGNEEILARALHSRFLGFPPLDVFKILKHRAKNRIPLYDCIYDEKVLKKIGVSDPKLISVFAKRLSKWAQAGHNDSVIDVFNTVLDESGFLTLILNSTRSVEMLEKLSGLARDVEQLAAGNREYTLRDLIHHLDLLDEYHIRISKAGGVDSSRRGVRLMTGHRSKGLEFDYVYLVGAWDTHWGNKRSMSAFSLPLEGAAGEQDNADERRLFYVALTRARQGVFVSYSRTSESGKERLPSQFVEEMDSAYKEEIDTDDFEEQ